MDPSGSHQVHSGTGACQIIDIIYLSSQNLTGVLKSERKAQREVPVSQAQRKKFKKMQNPSTPLRPGTPDSPVSNTLSMCSQFSKFHSSLCPIFHHSSSKRSPVGSSSEDLFSSPIPILSPPKRHVVLWSRNWIRVLRRRFRDGFFIRHIVYGVEVLLLRTLSHCCAG